MSSIIFLHKNDISKVPSTWRTVSNKNIDIDIDFLTELAHLIAERNKVGFSISSTLKSKIDDCTNASDVLNIKWSTNA